MKVQFLVFICICFFIACSNSKETDKYPVKQTDWKSKVSDIEDFESFQNGKTYLPVYSHIYHVHDHRTFDLTATASIRNVSVKDTLYLLNADYYDTDGTNIRQYVKKPVYIKPLETLEIIIHENDIEGGSGANFLFDWAMRNDKNPPLFEAVMISTYGQQGISFTTRGVRIID